jgi:hypothetical protein
MLHAMRVTKLLDQITLWIHPNHQCEEYDAQVNEMFRLANEVAASCSDKPKAFLVKHESEVHIPSSRHRDRWGRW